MGEKMKLQFHCWLYLITKEVYFYSIDMISIGERLEKLGDFNRFFYLFDHLSMFDRITPMEMIQNHFGQMFDSIRSVV